jgi:DNA (cytosine-5)-methyltransferase 1
MITPQLQLPLHRDLVIDLFAGGGGASTGIEQAIGRCVDIAINHDPEAVSLHQANHPQTLHYVSDVFEVDPVTVTDGRPVGLLWASPDCKHFSKAKGGKPVSKKIRSLAWVVIKWAKEVRPRVICLENVEEFQHWGPLTSDTNMPCPLRKGKTFKAWKAQLQGLGYQVEHRELRACDYGAPTIRKRLFLVARLDGVAIDWPEPTHAAPDSLAVKARKLKPWATAAQCIDWSIQAPSIFERARPLADATCRRIAKGVVRYVIDAKEPYIVGDQVPTIISMGHGERAGQSPRVPGIEKPHSTITAQGQHSALVCAFLAKHYTGVTGSAMPDPMGTVTSVDHHSLVSASMITIDNQSSTGGASSIDEPIKTTTVENRHALVQAFLSVYYGVDQAPDMRGPLPTITTRDRFGLVTVRGQPYAIVDIGLRMLAPREVYRAQGFPDSYRIEHGADGRALTKTAQVRMCGNSVCPPLARAIVAANYQDFAFERKAA